MKVKLLILFFAFLLFEIPLGLNVNLAPGVSPKNLFLYVLLVFVVIDMMVSPTEFKFNLIGLHLAFLGLIAYIGVNWAVSSVGYTSFDYPVGPSFMNFKSSYVDRYLVLFVFLYGITSRRDAYFVLRVLVGIVVFSSFLTLLDVLKLPDLAIMDVRDGRVEGPIGQPNQYGGFLAFWIPICICVYLTSQGKQKVFVGLGTIVTIGMLVLSGSRGAMLGSLAGAIVSVVYLRRYLRGKVIVRGIFAGLLVSVAIVLVVSVQFTEVVESRIERTTAGDASTVTAGRVDIWSKALQTMAKNPQSFIFGNGWRTFDPIIGRGAHNMYLNMLFELGVIGLILYLILLYKLLKLFRISVNQASGAARTYIIGVIFSFFAIIISTSSSELYRPWMLIWACTGLMLRLVLIDRADAKQSRIRSAQVPRQLSSSS